MFDSGHGLIGGDAAEHAFVFIGEVGGLGGSEASSSTTGSIGAEAGGSVGEDQNVEFTFQVTRVQGLGEDDFEGEFVLFEEPAGPAGGHETTVLVIQADADGFQLHGFAGGSSGDAVSSDAEGLRCGGEDGFGSGGSRDPDGACPEVLPVHRGGSLEPVDFGSGFQETVGDDESVILLVADEPAGRIRRAGDGGGGGVEETLDLRELAGNVVIEAVEFDGH